MQSLEAILARASDFVWGPPLLILLFGTHLFLTFRLRFIQRYLPQAIKLSFSREKEGDGDVSQFGALTTALAATIGTGNIVGVATAVAAGGPGAVLWMWLTGVFGIATKYAEAVLSVKYRVKLPNGMMAGGPMYALERGLGSKPLGMLFAALTAIAAFGIGNMTQANSISALANETFGVSPWITGSIMTVLTAIVILGGITSIASVCEKLVPFMAAFYVARLPHPDRDAHRSRAGHHRLIVSSAFTGQAAVGGFLGAGVMQAMRFGIARGLFSNESGLGSAPIVAAAAQTRNPVRQALVSSTGTFWDTVVVCAMTGIVVVNSGGWQQGLGGSALTKVAFEDLPTIGPIVLTIGLLTFVFSTILGWAYYGEKAAEYLFGPRVIVPYRDPVGAGRDGRLGLDAAGGLELLGRGQRPDGRAEPDLAAGAERRDRRRDAPLPLVGQPRQAGLTGSGRGARAPSGVADVPSGSAAQVPVPAAHLSLAPCRGGAGGAPAGAAPGRARGAGDIGRARDARATRRSTSTAPAATGRIASSPAMPNWRRSTCHHKSDAFDAAPIAADRNVAFPLDRLRELAARAKSAAWPRFICRSWARSPCPNACSGSRRRPPPSGSWPTAWTWPCSCRCDRCVTRP